MSDTSKVLLFGSFSEDETRSLLYQIPSNAQKPEEKKEMPVNSPNLGFSFGSFSDISDKKVSFPSGPGDTQPCTIQKNNQKLIQKSVTENLSIPSENGKVHVSTRNPHGNEVVDGHDFHELNLSGDADKIDGQSIPKSQNYEGIKLNGSVNGSAAEIHHKEARLKADVPVLDAQDIKPRGLINSGNLCFLNATLQALLACPPFVQLLLGLRKRNIPKVGYPTLAAFSEFIGEFDVVDGSNIKKKESIEIESGRPFMPSMFELVLRKFTPDVSGSSSGRPRSTILTHQSLFPFRTSGSIKQLNSYPMYVNRLSRSHQVNFHRYSDFCLFRAITACTYPFILRQEDAQEFLSFIMDQMHDELLKLGGKSHLDGGNLSLVSASEDDEWETVGRKNKSAVTRTQNFIPSELSSIFGGQLRSVVKAKGNKDSATVQPFLLLHLDISHEVIGTIEDALRLFSAPETLDEYRTTTAGKVVVVAARKRINIQALPRIMILHLKRFGYGSQGSTKLHKAVHFPLELVLSRDLLVSSNVEGRKYELVATVTHHGREASKGHYTADIRHCNSQWLRFDDASLTIINTTKVLHHQAYLLFYKQL